MSEQIIALIGVIITAISPIVAAAITKGVGGSRTRSGKTPPKQLTLYDVFAIIGVGLSLTALAVSALGQSTTENVPKGMIAVWCQASGDTIPKGWVLCTGDNGTPDLKDKFLRGVATVSESGRVVGPSDTTPGNGGGVIRVHESADGDKSVALSTHYHQTGTPAHYTVVYIMKQ